MRAEIFVCFNHFCTPTPACSRSPVHDCCMNEETNERPPLTVLLAPSPCNAEVFLSSPGHLTTGTLLSDIQADWHLAWNPERLAAPILGPEVNFGPLVAPGLSAPTHAAATTVGGHKFQNAPPGIAAISERGKQRFGGIGGVWG